MIRIVKTGRICNVMVLIGVPKLWKTATRTCRRILKLLASILHPLSGTMIMDAAEVVEEVEVDVVVVEATREDEVAKEVINRIAETTKATVVVTMTTEAEVKDAVATVTTKEAMVVVAKIM